MKMKSFPAKLLLFGEYTIIVGGAAIALPFWKYSGQWKEELGGHSLAEFYKHLLGIRGADVSAIETATKTLQYKSSIPLGYGLGSSGSLTAAAYSLFFPDRESLTLHETKAKLSEIESFFHGQSSGLDPLTCYYQQPVYFKNNDIRLLDSLVLPTQLKLLDSKKSRVSKPLIQQFKLQLENDAAYKTAVTELSNYNERIIAALLAKENIAALFKKISTLQYELFVRMIPAPIRTVWHEGLKTDKYYVKLSGAGGGGYFLVYEKEVSDTAFDLLEVH